MTRHFFSLKIKPDNILDDFNIIKDNLEYFPTFLKKSYNYINDNNVNYLSNSKEKLLFLFEYENPNIDNYIQNYLYNSYKYRSFILYYDNPNIANKYKILSNNTHNKIHNDFNIKDNYIIIEDMTSVEDVNLLADYLLSIYNINLSAYYYNEGDYMERSIYYYNDNKYISFDLLDDFSKALNYIDDWDHNRADLIYDNLEYILLGRYEDVDIMAKKLREEYDLLKRAKKINKIKDGIR